MAAAPASTLQTYTSGYNAENVTKIIQNVSPFDTPLYTMAKKGMAEATYTEWPIESLAVPNTANAEFEGGDAVNEASTTPTRVGNYCQTLVKVPQVSYIQSKVKKYGATDEFDRQLVKKGKELKIDIETAFFLNQARVIGTAGVAQRMRGLPGWLTTNVSRGAAGANGSATTAATDGTQRNFTEALFRGVIVQCATNANEVPSVIMAGVANRANISSQLSGNSTRFYEIKDSELSATISVYRSDFGTHKIVSNRWQRARDMFFISPDYIEVRNLEPISYQELAKTGLSDRGELWTTTTLAVLNEAAHGVLADLNTAVI